ncbi:hypothetical protein BDB00DRAFT_878674 [Zychaea mexicana]|uniref:uncharacterized protein n=1 Tax=Zychaea mexicana TaxID=64656 RepID=UPI0022FE26CF|nr:uncharacterized protein BDB00DRAFT_878674 [Zychaea mexicana]KAI9484608.1 hypothetical protein BDB00DRAFT_878674 [Zychaea mexicana]
MAFLIYYSARHAERETRLRDKASSSMKQQVQEMKYGSVLFGWMPCLPVWSTMVGIAFDSRQSTLGNRLSAIDSRQSTLNIDSQG